jgi:hypothetical protein
LNRNFGTIFSNAEELIKSPEVKINFLKEAKADFLIKNSEMRASLYSAFCISSSPTSQQVSENIYLYNWNKTYYFI